MDAPLISVTEPKREVKEDVDAEEVLRNTKAMDAPLPSDFKLLQREFDVICGTIAFFKKAKTACAFERMRPTIERLLGGKKKKLTPPQPNKCTLAALGKIQTVYPGVIGMEVRKLEKLQGNEEFYDVEELLCLTLMPDPEIPSTINARKRKAPGIRAKAEPPESPQKRMRGGSMSPTRRASPLKESSAKKRKTTKKSVGRGTGTATATTTSTSTSTTTIATSNATPSSTQTTTTTSVLTFETRSEKFRYLLGKRVVDWAATTLESLPAADYTDVDALWELVLATVPKIEVAALPVPIPMADLHSESAQVAEARGDTDGAALLSALAARRRDDVAECDGSESVPLLNIMKHVRKQAWYCDQIKYVEHVEAREADYAPRSFRLHERVRELLSARGIEQLYLHQSEAIDAIRRGEHTIVSTSTASGKSIIYIVPIVEAFLRDPTRRFLLIFPTKALAQDQLRSMKELLGDVLVVNTYDGDTPHAKRKELMDESHVLLTNVDTLHVTILPRHHAWRQWLDTLAYVVVDEAHYYDGVFGSHVCMVMRRLRRLLKDNEPTFILCSATIGNPTQHAVNLVGVNFTLVDNESASSGQRDIVVWRPPLRADVRDRSDMDTIRSDFYGQVPQLPSSVGVAATSSVSNVSNIGVNVPLNGDSESARRVSLYTEALRLYVELLMHGYRTLVFAPSRRTVELLSQMLNAELDRRAVTRPLKAKVATYRGGYTKEERRDIEKALFSGELCGVISTCALELGIDVGVLDCVLSVGFEGSVSSLRQRFGRCGRGQAPALNVLILFDDALNAHWAASPAQLLSSRTEHCVVSLDNQQVMQKHLQCAAAERAVDSVADAVFFGADALRECTEALCEKAQLRVTESDKDRRVFTYCGTGVPARAFGLRQISDTQWKIIDSTNMKEIEQLDEWEAQLRTHLGAIYLYRSRAYIVTEWRQHTCEVLIAPSDVTYYTKPMDHMVPRIRKVLQVRDSAHLRLEYGSVHVARSIPYFKKIRQRSGQIFDRVPLELPMCPLNTCGVVLRLGVPCLRAVDAFNADKNEGDSRTVGFRNMHEAMHGVEHLIVSSVPLYAKSAIGDLGCGACDSSTIDFEAPALAVFDAKGPSGVSERLFNVIEQVLQSCLTCVQACLCTNGCPECIFSSTCHDANANLSKAGARELLDVMVNGK